MGKKKKSKSSTQNQVAPTPTPAPSPAPVQTPETKTNSGVADNMKAYIQKAQQEREMAKNQTNGEINVATGNKKEEGAVDTSTTSNSLNVDWLDKKLV